MKPKVLLRAAQNRLFSLLIDQCGELLDTEGAYIFRTHHSRELQAIAKGLFRFQAMKENERQTLTPGEDSSRALCPSRPPEEWRHDLALSWTLVQEHEQPTARAEALFSEIHSASTWKHGQAKLCTNLKNIARERPVPRRLRDRKERVETQVPKKCTPSFPIAEVRRDKKATTPTLKQFIEAFTFFDDHMLQRSLSYATMKCRGVDRQL
jgi:hypothetical protein